MGALSMCSQITLRAGLVISLIAFSAFAMAASAQTAAAPSTIDALIGEWSGEGKVLGADGRLTLRFARVMKGRFLELTYLAEPAQGGTFEGRALYRIAADCAGDGQWFDSNGASYAIVSRCAEGALETTWGNERIQGSSRYSPKDGQLSTADFIKGADGELREFTAVMLTRAQGGTD